MLDSWLVIDLDSRWLERETTKLIKRIQRRNF